MKARDDDDDDNCPGCGRCYTEDADPDIVVHTGGACPDAAQEWCATDHFHHTCPCGTEWVTVHDDDKAWLCVPDGSSVAHDVALALGAARDARRAGEA